MANPSSPTSQSIMQNTCNKKFKAIVFDYGGVIEISEGVNILNNIAEIVGVPANIFKDEYFNHNHLSNVENLSWKDMIMKVVSVFDTKGETNKKVLKAIKESNLKKKINNELLHSFLILKKQGFKIAIFSNHTSELRKRLAANGIMKLIDEVIVSGEIGFQKPHKEAFQILFEKLNVLPKEVVFIDDAPKSLEKATEIGYTPILFKNNKQLKIELQNLGIQL